MSLITLSHNFTIFSPNRFWIAIFFGHIIPLFYLSGPFLFFYTRNALKNSTKLSQVDYFHFLPFIISLISIFPYYFTDFDSKLRIAQLIIENPAYLLKINFSWLYPSKINLLLRPIILLGYSIYCIFILYKYLIKRKTTLSINKQEKIILKWLILINCIIALLSISYSFFTIRFYYNPNLLVREVSGTSILTYILGFLFFLIPILLLAFPEILYGFEKFKKNTSSKKELCKQVHESLEGKTELILDVIKKEENLLNPNFGIDEICKTLNIEKQEVLYCFNMILKTKYITLRKELRVNLAKKELSNGKLLSHSMEGIWIKSGFLSKTSFFVAFKEVTGMTPVEYSKSLEKQKKEGE
jgi:AraC-like DNA-binding protein